MSHLGILEIDAGNSSLKWRWRGAAAASVADISRLDAALGNAGPPEQVLVCSVRGAEFEAELSAWLARKWNLRPRFARVLRNCGGVRIQYPDPAALGADRWLAMLAGYRRARGSCLIVDSGTALTIDMLDADGLHLGGYILPGLRTAQSGLLQNTGIVLPPESGAVSSAPGNDTGAAIRNGALFMLCSAIQVAAQRMMGENGAGATLILSGGDAPALRRELELEPVLLVPELVLDGLSLGACAVGIRESEFAAAGKL